MPFLTVYGGGSLQVYLYLFFFACFKKSSQDKGPSMSSREGVPLLLTLEEIREIAADLKEDYQRQANQGIRKKDWEQGVGALASMECIEHFVYACSLRAGEFAPATAEKRHEILGAPPSTKKRKRGAVTELPAPVSVVRKRVLSQ
jgi:hypothetical protein